MKTVEQRAHTAETLTRRVGPEFVANRSGGAAGGLTYMEGSKVFELANSIFGYDGQSIVLSLPRTTAHAASACLGWSTDLRELVEDFVRVILTTSLVVADLHFAVLHDQGPVASSHRLFPRYRSSNAPRRVLS